MLDVPRDHPWPQEPTEAQVRAFVRAAQIEVVTEYKLQEDKSNPPKIIVPGWNTKEMRNYLLAYEYVYMQAIKLLQSLASEKHWALIDSLMREWMPPQIFKLPN